MLLNLGSNALWLHVFRYTITKAEEGIDIFLAISVQMYLNIPETQNQTQLNIQIKLTEVFVFQQG